MLLIRSPIRALVLALAAVLALASGSAVAHSMVASSEPADGATIAEAPTRISVSFDSPLRIVSVSLTDGAGESYAVDPLAGRSAAETLAVEPPALPAGRYELEWRGLSEDGHTLTDTITFSVSGD
ncbi:copper resistance CopC family protein [Spiribacter vilamensis]|uniref:Copper resistance protein C n=1 Tax=Spiribacter vilamensis TaxID=531306 RepID=A0A4Q8CZ27_9GAMM|nr:copper resistance CopC family protein [Spiribacter vilamensis]RZU98253.1 hypothetical protein EV698_0497 [Spiribacter vilamensis]TVO60851.1 copper resistance protein CopC [Spiribacter vilamensis]